MKKRTSSKSAKGIRVEPPFEGQVRFSVQLPPALLEWAEDHAYNQDYYLSDYLCGLLEVEKFKADRPRTTHVPDREISGRDEHPLGIAPEDALGTFGTDSTDPKAFGVVVESDDMSPEIKTGDTIVVEPGAKIKPGDIGLVKLNDGRQFLRRMTIKKGTARLSGTACADLDVPVSEIQFAYRVFESSRKH